MEEKCKYCKTKIDKKAKICPNCQKKQGNKVLIIIAVIIVLLIIIGASGSDKNTNTVTDTANNDNNNIINNDADKVNNSTSNNDAEKKVKYNVGETFSNKSINLKFIEKDENFTGYSEYASVKEGCKVVKATFEMENISISDKYATYTDFNCYADGYSCENFYSVDDAGLTGGLNTTLSSGKKASGSVYFQVPQNAESITIEYYVNMWTSEKIEFIIK